MGLTPLALFQFYRRSAGAPLRGSNPDDDDFIGGKMMMV